MLRFSIIKVKFYADLFQYLIFKTINMWRNHENDLASSDKFNALQEKNIALKRKVRMCV